LKRQNGKPALSQDHVFALRGHTIKTENGKYFTKPTLENGKASGPYKTLQACCAAIARKNAEEFTTRRTRVERFHAKRRQKSAS
jgi:hypothetical protein